MPSDIPTLLLMPLPILYTDDKLMKKPQGSVEAGNYGSIKPGPSAWLLPREGQA